MMEKRQAGRVQFFQFNHDRDLEPIWIFRRAKPKSVLGLLLDVSEDGVQILTDKGNPMNFASYQLIVHSDECPFVNFSAARARHLWSKADGTHYVRNGFAFDGVGDLTSFIAKVLVAREDGHRLLRCELAVLTNQTEGLAVH